MPQDSFVFQKFCQNQETPKREVKSACLATSEIQQKVYFCVFHFSKKHKRSHVITSNTQARMWAGWLYYSYQHTVISNMLGDQSLFLGEYITERAQPQSPELTPLNTIMLSASRRRQQPHTHSHAHTDTQTHRHTDRHTHRQTHTHRHRHTHTHKLKHKHKHKHTHTHTDTQTHTHTQCWPVMLSSDGRQYVINL